MSSDRHVLVTGGSRGLGLAIVRHLLAGGYRVSCCSRATTPELDELLVAHAGRLRWWMADLSSPEAAAKFVADALAAAPDATAWGLVNNAGVAAEGILSTLPVVDIDKVIQTDLVAPILLARAFLRHLLRLRTGGRIINIGSITGLRGYTGLVPYGAAKAGLDGMTRALAREVGRRGITVNTVAPGYMETDLSGTLSGRQRDQIVRRTPLGRLCELDDVVPLVAFLLGDDSGFISGQTLVIDGALTC